MILHKASISGIPATLILRLLNPGISLHRIQFSIITRRFPDRRFMPVSIHYCVIPSLIRSRKKTMFCYSEFAAILKASIHASGERGSVKTRFQRHQRKLFLCIHWIFFIRRRIAEDSSFFMVPFAIAEIVNKGGRGVFFFSEKGYA